MWLDRSPILYLQSEFSTFLLQYTMCDHFDMYLYTHASSPSTSSTSPSSPCSCWTEVVIMAAVVQKELISKIRSRNENQIHSTESVSQIGKPQLVTAKKAKAVTRLPSNQAWTSCPPKPPPPYRELAAKKKTADEEMSSELSLQKESPVSSPDGTIPSPKSSQVRKTHL